MEFKITADNAEFVHNYYYVAVADTLVVVSPVSHWKMCELTLFSVVVPIAISMLAIISMRKSERFALL